MLKLIEKIHHVTNMYQVFTADLIAQVRQAKGFGFEAELEQILHNIYIEEIQNYYLYYWKVNLLLCKIKCLLMINIIWRIHQHTISSENYITSLSYSLVEFGPCVSQLIERWSHKLKVLNSKGSWSKDNFFNSAQNTLITSNFACSHA